jgi:hypothetical protein
MKLVEPPTNGHKSNIIEVVFDKPLTRAYRIYPIIIISYYHGHT